MSRNTIPRQQRGYIYDAAGTKLTKYKVENSIVTDSTHYIGNFIYNQDSLSLILTDEGRCTPEGNGNYLYEYFIKDHLGNNRVSFADTDNDNIANLTQEDHYYPFGMTMDGLSYINGVNKNKYLYNGKELQDDQIAGINLDWYDYGARMYDVNLGRWYALDELSEKYVDISPYNYVLNNPSNAVDPDGRLVIFVNGFTSHAGNYRPFPPRIEFNQNEPLFNGKSLGHNDFGPNYSGYNYWENLDVAFMDLFDDRNSLYAYGGNKDGSTAKDRYERGRLAAIYFHDEVIGGNIKLEENETIKIVGHSHGAAYASGLAKELMRRGYPVEYVYYVAAHQPTDIEHPDGAKGVQLIRESDWVSSDQKWYIKAVSRSKFGKIDGVDAESFYVLPDMDEGRGGHSAWTYVEWLCKQVIANGGTVTVNGEEQ